MVMYSFSRFLSSSEVLACCSSGYAVKERRCPSSSCSKECRASVSYSPYPKRASSSFTAPKSLSSVS